MCFAGRGLSHDPVSIKRSDNLQSNRTAQYVNTGIYGEHPVGCSIGLILCWYFAELRERHLIGEWRSGSAPALGAGGRGFDPRLPDHNLINARDYP